MDNHLTDDEIERYLDENALASDHARVHGHLAECDACAETWREIIAAHEALIGTEAETPEVEQLDDASNPRNVAGATTRDHSRKTMIRAAVVLLAASLGAAIGRAIMESANDRQAPTGTLRTTKR